MNNIEQQISENAKEIFNKIVSYRKLLHQNPELSFEEFATSKYVVEKLREIGIFHITTIGKTGVTALIVGDHHKAEQDCIALRADLDALPIQEENDCDYASIIAGKMHACGHDVHTAILLGAAEILFKLRNQLPHPVKLIFQPGEEKNPGGASILIEEAVLENPKVKEIYALHVFPELEVGKLGFKEGLYMASCDEIHLTIHGKGGHGATPHQCIDPILIGANIVSQLQQIVSRKCDPKIPCVLSFGHFEALGATNIIPSKAIIKGTFRTMDEAWRNEALIEIEKQIKHIIESQGATVEINIDRGYPFLKNDPSTTEKLQNKAKAHFGTENVVDLPIRLTSEDFSYYSQHVPATFFRLGVRNEEKGIIYGVHHPKFDIDANAILIGMQAMCLAAIG